MGRAMLLAADLYERVPRREQQGQYPATSQMFYS